MTTNIEWRAPNFKAFANSPQFLERFLTKRYAVSSGAIAKLYSGRTSKKAVLFHPFVDKKLFSKFSKKVLDTPMGVG